MKFYIRFGTISDSGAMDEWCSYVQPLDHASWDIFVAFVKAKLGIVGPAPFP